MAIDYQEILRNPDGVRILFRNAMLLSIIFLLVGGIIGMLITRGKELDWCFEKGLYFLRVEGIDIGINQGLVKAFLLQYRGELDKILNETNETKT